MHRVICFLLICTAGMTAAVDNPAPRPNGPFPHFHRCHALTGATVVTEPGVAIENAVLIIRDGMIEAIGQDVTIPPDARLWPVDGHFIYPGFIEPASTMSMDSEGGAGSHWNERIRPERICGNRGDMLPQRDRAALRKAGYCVAAIYPDDGILRGTGVITTLADEDAALIDCGGQPAMAASFERGGWGEGGGPGSLMGSIALMRQTVSDARWYQEAHAAAERNQLEPPTQHHDLDALQAVVNRTQRIMIDTQSVKESMRAAALAKELDLDLILLGSGDEYLDISGIQSTGAPIIVPLTYPERPQLTSIDSAIRVPLRTLQTWEQAPTNVRRLMDASVSTCVTTQGLDQPSDVHGALQDAISGGLPSDEALAQLTTRPASLLQIDDRVGRIAPGMAAHLVICSGPLFEDDTSIEETWVSGHREDHEEDPMVILSGSGSIHLGDAIGEMTIDTAKPSLTIKHGDDQKAKVKKVNMTGHRIQAVVDGRLIGEEDWLRVAGVIRNQKIIGRAVRPDGSTLPMHMQVTAEIMEDNEETKEESEDDSESEVDTDPVEGLWSGFMAFGADFEPPMEVEIRAEGQGYLGTVRVMEQEMSDLEGTFDESSGTLRFSGSGPSGGGLEILATISNDDAVGTVTSPMGEAEFTLSRAGSNRDGGMDQNESEARWQSIPKDIPFPLGGRGRFTPPTAENVRFENATLWTASDAGIIEDGCLVIRDGHITYAGTMADAPSGDERIIDAQNMHITPGLIDCHSHTGIDGGVNEFNESCTAEVGIGDVVAADDMNWYRQLAGGLTAANQLHGSANPIGGRNSVIKLRWGHPARGFRMLDATPGIKFALGENVKRRSGRYPDTRMGVDAFMRDRLAAAQHYAKTWRRWNAMSEQDRAAEIPPRRDYELQTIAEILAGERLIHCHSYRQDEILALLRTCEEFGITIGTLQHILEGYKVADDIARHGAGASAFSDWWAYKVEVMDAIPWNGVIMHDQGVVVSFNSDDGELATRMNDEAAKAVRYGGLSPNEALKFVTLNPAKQLKIDHLTGSLEAGKDADFAVWNMDPLNSFSLCQQTWIDGARYFDRTEDAALATRDAEERSRLVQLVLLDALGAPPTLEEAKADSSEEESSPAWAANPYLEPADDHRGCCGIPTGHVHTEECQ